MNTNDLGEPRRPLADDESFLAGLSDLDRGLEVNDAPRRAPTRGKPPTFSATTLPPIVTEPGHRPLLNIFPEDTLAPKTVDDIVQPDPSTCEGFYGLHDAPFSLSSDPKFLYQSAEYDRVAQQMLGAIGRREPLVLLTGEAGVGKTMLCRSIIEQIDRRTLTSFVDESVSSMGELLKTLLIDFGVASRDDVSRGRLASAAEGELAAALHEFLVSLAPLQAFAVVMIDDAQALPAQMLHDLSRIVSPTSERLMQIILIGRPELARLLEKPAAQDISRAVSLRLLLGPLLDDEVAPYVAHRLHVAGAHPRVGFDEPATDRMFALSGGSPQLVNVLGDCSLTAGFTRFANIVDEELVNRAADELDMAPPGRAGARGPFATAGMLLLLALVGAAVGAITFHGDIAAILARWH